jgi:hypothetical protein
MRQVKRRLLPLPEGQRERIARAIMGKGEILSEKLKEFLKEVEDLHDLIAGKLARTIETRLRIIVEPSEEQMQEAIKKEIRTVEEENLENMPGPDGAQRSTGQ